MRAAPSKTRPRRLKGTWIGSLKITQKDLDSIPDDAWKTIAVEFGVGWSYAAASNERGREPAAA